MSGNRLASCVGDRTLGLLYDFGTEVLGRVQLEFSAARGTELDLFYSERLKNDGPVDQYCRSHVALAERYIARDGAQTWHVFHPRGLRYLQIMVTGDIAAFDLHRVCLTRANYPAKQLGAFRCSDSMLNEIWALGPPTLQACMEDAYLDCPMRERGLYAGDFLVEFLADMVVHGDPRLMRRCIEIFLVGQGEDGLIRAGAHGIAPGRHPDYSAILVQSLWEYFARTGDKEFVSSMEPQLGRLLAGMGKMTLASGGLADGTGFAPYIDRAHVDKEGVSCALNCFFQRAFYDAARLYQMMGSTPKSRYYAQNAAEMTLRIRHAFRDPASGLYLDRRKEEKPDTCPSVPSNVLALLYGIARKDEAPRILEFIVRSLRDNFRLDPPAVHQDWNVSAYFSFYAIGLLYGHGRAVEAEDFIRKYWGRMLKKGAWTCWEFLEDFDSASRCHAWSASPTYYLSSRALGATYPEPGNPNLICIAPQAGTLTWAKGTVPHPRGGIEIAWRKEGTRILASFSAPAGVRVELAKGIEHDGCVP